MPDILYERVSELDPVLASDLSDVIYAIQDGVSIRESLQQVVELGHSYTVLHYAGNPNGSVAGILYQFCLDTTNNKLYICTTAGTTATAVWTIMGAAIVAPIQGGTGVSSPTARTIPVAQGSTAFTFLGPLTNGQLLVGSTGANPVPATITAGTNISVTNGAGTIAIAASGAASFGWTEVTGTTQAISINNGYISSNVALVSLSLPITSVVGSRIEIVGKGAGGWRITQGASQQIQIGSNATTVGAAGTASSSNRYDSIILVCTTADTIWTSVGAPEGSITCV
jgi:hypothetical protein